MNGTAAGLPPSGEEGDTRRVLTKGSVEQTAGAWVPVPPITQ